MRGSAMRPIISLPAAIMILITIIVGFIIIAILIISWQISLSKIQKRRFGFILPAISLLISLIMCLQVPFYYESPYSREFIEEGYYEEYYEKYDMMRISSNPMGTYPVYMFVKPSPIKYLDDDGELIIIGETIVEKIPGAILDMLAIFGLYNICTVILLVINFVCRKEIMKKHKL